MPSDLLVRYKRPLGLPNANGKAGPQKGAIPRLPAVSSEDMCLMWGDFPRPQYQERELCPHGLAVMGDDASLIFAEGAQ